MPPDRLASKLAGLIRPAVAELVPDPPWNPIWAASRNAIAEFLAAHPSA